MRDEDKLNKFNYEQYRYVKTYGMRQLTVITEGFSTTRNEDSVCHKIFTNATQQVGRNDGLSNLRSRRLGLKRWLFLLDFSVRFAVSLQSNWFVTFCLNKNALKKMLVLLINRRHCKVSRRSHHSSWNFWAFYRHHETAGNSSTFLYVHCLYTDEIVIVEIINPLRCQSWWLHLPCLKGIVWSSDPACRTWNNNSFQARVRLVLDLWLLCT